MQKEKRPAARGKTRRIQASELSTFHYCARALGYQRAGEPSENQKALESGLREHDALSRRSQFTRALVTGLIILLVLSGLALWLMIRLGGMAR